MIYFVCSEDLGDIIGKVRSDEWQIVQSVAPDKISYKPYYIPTDGKQNDNEYLRELAEKFVSSFTKDDIAIVQHPSWRSLQFEAYVLSYLKRIGVRIIMSVDDIMYMQAMFGADVIVQELNMFKLADVLILHSEMMYYHILEYGVEIDKSKVVYRTVYDYICDFNIDAVHYRYTNVLNYIGNVSKMTNDWSRLSNIRYIMTYGTVDQMASGPFHVPYNMSYFGNVDNFELFGRLAANGGYGLVWVDDKLLHLYYRYNLPYKLSNYLVAGLPVIVHSQSNYADFVRNNGIGLVVSKLEDIAQAMSMVNEYNYYIMCERVKAIARKIRTGEYGKRVFVDAFSKIMCQSVFDKSEK